MSKAIDAVGNAFNSAVQATSTFISHATQPLQSTFSRAVIDPIAKATTRAVTPPGTGADRSVGVNIDNGQTTPARLPTSKPANRGMQSSFLSGVAGGAAATGLPGSGGSSAGSGKSLLGQ